MKLAKSEQTKRVIAILVLQRGMKRYYEEKMQGSTVLQRAYRKRQEAKKRHAYFILRRLIWTNLHVRGLAEVKNAKLAEAALTMQRLRRGKTGKSDYLILRAAVSRIQRVYRGRHGRRQYEELKGSDRRLVWALTEALHSMICHVDFEDELHQMMDKLRFSLMVKYFSFP